MVNQTRLFRVNAVPTAPFALEVQRGSIPGHPGAKRSFALTSKSPPSFAPVPRPEVEMIATREKIRTAALWPSQIRGMLVDLQ